MAKAGQYNCVTISPAGKIEEWQWLKRRHDTIFLYYERCPEWVNGILSCVIQSQTSNKVDYMETPGRSHLIRPVLSDRIEFMNPTMTIIKNIDWVGIWFWIGWVVIESTRCRRKSCWGNIVNSNKIKFGTCIKDGTTVDNIAEMPEEMLRLWRKWAKSS